MKKMFIAAAAFLFSFSLSAQTADFVTEMLNTQYADYAQVSYLSAVCQGLVDEKTSYGEAFSVLKEHGQVPARADADSGVSLADLSFIMAELWPVRGGLMFRLSGGSPRYAFRQLKVDGIIPPDADPSEKVSGTDVLNMYTACENRYGGGK
jgi:hypothetical protein